MIKNLLLVLLFQLLQTGNADVVEIDGIYYRFSGDEAYVTWTIRGSDNRTDYSGSVVIPEYVTYNEKRYHVTGIDGSAFSGCRGLTSVAIPGSVTWIGGAAFRLCIYEA